MDHGLKGKYRAIKPLGKIGEHFQDVQWGKECLGLTSKVQFLKGKNR